MPALDFLRRFDKRPATFSPNFNSHYSYRSRQGGFISLTCKLIFIIFLILKSIDLIGRKNVTYNMKIIKENDLSALDFSDAGIQIKVIK